eukprot:c23839_g1_i3 orf=579-1709(-)
MMPKAKQKFIVSDLVVQGEHIGAPIIYNNKHPIQTVAALRLILSTPVELQPSIIHELYKAYWVDNVDVSDDQVLKAIAKNHKVSFCSINEESVKLQLHHNTERLADMGAFGLPCFIVNGRFYWGQDRLFLVERALGRSLAKPRRILRSKDTGMFHTLVFYHDFSSPWSFLASLQVAAIVHETQATLIYKPFLVGALFKSIGTPIEPMKELTMSKASYARQDMVDWSDYLGSNFKFPSVFPIYSVLALRVALCNTEVTDTIYHAAWVQDKRISERFVLSEVLKEAGFDADLLLEQAESKEIKNQLRENTAEAISLGACGAPTFQVLDPNGQHVALVWGQDRLNIVADMLSGWRPKSGIHNEAMIYMKLEMNNAVSKL